MPYPIEKIALIEQMRSQGPFVYLSVEHIEFLLDSVQIEDAIPGDLLIIQGDSDRDYLLLLDGELEVTRKFSGANGEQELHVGLAKAGEGVGEMSLLSSLSRSASVRATRPSKILRIDGGKMDELLAWSEEFAGHLGATAEERRRMNLLHQTKGFGKLPLHNIQAAIRRMQPVTDTF